MIHLSPKQVAWRVRRKLPRLNAKKIRSPITFSPPHGQWVESPRKTCSMVAPLHFRVLNQTHQISSRQAWNPRDSSALFRYNLHYFDDLVAMDGEKRENWHRQLISRWIEDNPPFTGVGWDPYPTSLRIVNWLKWMIAGNLANDDWLQSLALQTESLYRAPEFDLRTNHLLANAKALIFASAALDTARASQWRTKGIQILNEEIPEQVLADGGHIERSPMYHALVLEDILDLLNVITAYPSGFHHADFAELLIPRARSMINWLSCMTPPSGELSRFNDAAPGVAMDLADLIAYASRLGIFIDGISHPGFTLLPESGYVRLQRDPITLLFDVSPLEPNYNPGHAHADTLSFELTWGTHPVIVNSGTSQYGSGPDRLWERSTAAHNTIQIDRQSSSEVWSGFRVARRAHPFGLDWSSAGSLLRVGCSHDGYKRLPGSPVHRREIDVGESFVSWTDQIEGDGHHIIEGRIPLHVGVEVQKVSPVSWKLKLPGNIALVLNTSGVSASIEIGRFAPEFGRVIPRPVIAWSFEGKLPFEASFVLYSPAHAYSIPH
jgi:uncharacterized heparinase superfamily protein